MKWVDVDWERSRFRVISPKTEHHEGKARRWVPIFPELRPVLEEAWEQAEEGAVYVVDHDRLHNGGQNLRTTLQKIIRRAGLKPWPRLFQNLRATRETELAARFPVHIVTAWIGNSTTIAAKHYLQVTDADFEAATQGAAQSGAVVVQKAVQQGASPTLTESHDLTEVLAGCDSVRDGERGYEDIQDSKLGTEGFEPPTSSV